MAEEPAVIAAKGRIEQVLSDFVRQRAEAKVSVFVNDFGHLHAVVASGAFENMPYRERQELVREYLKVNAAPDDLAHLYRVFVLSASEFDENYSRTIFNGGETESLTIPKQYLDDTND